VPAGLTAVLVGVGRNLNRAYRTCYSFGVESIMAVDCTAQLSGNLYSADGRVVVTTGSIDDIPPTAVWLEVDGDVSATEIDWTPVTHLVVGGESVTLPRMSCYARAHIPVARPLCLTVEAALAVALGYTRLPAPRIHYVGYGLYASPLPRRRDVLSIAGRVRTWIDLTQRPRPTIERACRDSGIIYHKLPTGYDEPITELPDVELPAAVSCFHGRDRTGRFVEGWRARGSL